MEKMQYAGKRSAILLAGVLSSSLLLSACVSNTAQGLANAALQNGGMPNSGSQLATSMAQAALNKQGGGAAAFNVDLPAKMSCKDVTKRLIQTRSDLGAQPAIVNAPVATDGKLAIASGLASLVGAATGNAQLAEVGNQLSGAGSSVQGNPQTSLEAMRLALEGRAASMKCKLPLEARVSPAVAKMSCNQVSAEWLSLHQRAAAPAPAAAGVGSLLGGRGGDLQNKLAMAGAVASVAANLTGNQELATVANLAGGNAAPTQVAASTGSFAREELETLASAKRCKLPNLPVATAAMPAAQVMPMSCGHLKQELKALNSVVAQTAPANQLAGQAQTVGMLASVAGALTGNQALKTVGDQANALAGAGAPAGEVQARRAALEAQAKVQRCKI